jgi:hypothetical protein
VQMFDLVNGGVAWIEPAYVAACVPFEYTTPEGHGARSTTIHTIVGAFEVKDPNWDVGKTIARLKANRSAEISTIVHTFARSAQQAAAAPGGDDGKRRDPLVGNRSRG